MAFIRRNHQTLIIAFLALNILGAVLVLFTPFGGMTIATAYGPRERFVILGGDYSELLYNLNIVLITFGLLITALLCFMIFRTTRSGREPARKTRKPASVISIITVLIAIFGGFSFNIVTAKTGYLDWWLDTGFYAGLIIGLLNSVFSPWF